MIFLMSDKAKLINQRKSILSKYMDSKLLE